MYRRYSQDRRENVSISRMRHTRIRDILIVILVLALAVLAYFAVPAIRNNEDKRDTYIQQIRNECEEARETANKLSSSGGTENRFLLASIRSNLHAIQSLNETYIKAYNEKLLTDDQNDKINSMLTMIKNYYEKGTENTSTELFANEMRNRTNELDNELRN